MLNGYQASRRQVLAGLAGLAVAGATGGCAKSSSSGGVLNVWGGVPAENGPKDLFAAFEKKFPGTKVVYTRYVNDDPGNLKLDTALQGGAPIDIFFSYGANRVSQRVAAKLPLDITERATAEKAFAPLVDKANPRTYRFDDRIYSLSTTRSPVVVLINQTMLEKAGATLPTHWTIDEFHQLARKLSGDGVYGAFTIPDTARIILGRNHWFKPDGSASNFDDPAFRQEMDLHLAMIRDRSALPWDKVLSQHLQLYQQNSFLSGKFALWVTSPFSLRFISDLQEYPHDFKVACAPQPTGPNGEDWNTGTYEDNVHISAKSKNVDGAWDFVKFWLTDGAKYMVRAGKIPILPVVEEQDAVAKLLGDNRDTLYDVDSFREVLFTQQAKIPVDTLLIADQQINTTLLSTSDRCLLGEISTDEWVRTVKSQADAAIAKAH